MSLSRRFILVFVAYLAIIAVGAILVVRFVTLRDQDIEREEAIITDAQLSTDQRTDLDAARDQVEDRRTQINVVIAATLGAALLTTIVAGYVLRRSVLRPLDRVGTAVRNVRAGARHTTVPATGPPEVARLAADVEDLRRRLNVQVLEAIQAREAMEASASVLLSLRSQLEPEFSELPGEWTVAAQVEPAEGVVAGDCYDLVRVSASQFGVVVVDISGHGAVSGIVALRCRELLRAALRNGLEPGAAIDWACDQLDDLDDEQFLSAFVAIADLATGSTRYANAGHPPPLLCESDGAIELEPTGPIVGPFGRGWRTELVTINPGDTLAIYTDGLTEVRSTAGDEFGVARLAELVCGSSCDEADQIVKRCTDEVAAYAPTRLRDDATIVLLCRGPREDRPSVSLSA